MNKYFKYLQGNLRNKLWKNHKGFIRKHIREQIEFRIFVMDSECRVTGSCTKCGCSTPALQMCNDACKGNCYPKMMNKSKWDCFKTTGTILLAVDDLWLMTFRNKISKFFLYHNGRHKFSCGIYAEDTLKPIFKTILKPY